MDWIDSERTAKPSKSARGNTKTAKPRKAINLAKQLTAALAQPQEVWSAAFDHALSSIAWPKQCDAELTWLWSSLIVEQAEVLVRAGLSASKVAETLQPKPTKKRADEEPAVGELPQVSAQIALVSSLMSDSLESRAGQWLDEADAYPHAALGIIATLWHLPEHARREDSQWLNDWLSALVERAAEYQQQQEDCLLSNLVFHCELPLLMGLLTATSRTTAQNNASRAMDDLAEYLENSQDHIGSWLAHGASYLRAALASVFRSRVIADHLGLRKWYPPQKKALSELLGHAARWARQDGTQMLAHGLTIKKSRHIWKALCSQASVTKRVKHAMVLAGLVEGEISEAKAHSDTRLPATTLHDEEASCVLMQRGWKYRGPKIAVDFSEAIVSVEALNTKGCPILSGQWSAAVEFNGSVQMQLAGWEQLCWYADDDVDYLEIEAKFGEHAKLQRQLIFFRDHRLLLAADALLADCDGDWTLSASLPLPTDIRFESKAKHTEAILVNDRVQSLVMPLYLPEWHAAPASGSFQADNKSLVVTNKTHQARRVYAPVLISLCNRHSKHPYTWRQLTVAEDLKIASRDQAVAYRAQIGADQYVIYRNLAKVCRRSFLGVHALCEFFAGSFDKETGEADTLIEVELNK
jgi:hypothetical protein